MTGNERNDLLPCPHCGSYARLFEIEYPCGSTGWLLSSFPGCVVCNHISSIEPEDVDSFVECWNDRNEVER